MQQNYTDIADYFEQLADKHKQIKTFCRYELDELLSKTASIRLSPVWLSKASTLTLQALLRTTS